MSESLFGTTNAQQRMGVLKAVLSTIALEDRVARQDIEKRVVTFGSLASELSNNDLQSIAAEIETLVHIVVDPDPEVVDPSSFDEWLTTERKAEIAWNRWEAYSSLLHSKVYSPAVVDRMGQRADTILQLAGDPRRAGSWARRGLVIGDVQSGKTANYLALFNKAADAGYKIIILFGGHTDKLRRQTQERIDEGFVGRDSRKLAAHTPGVFVNPLIGVGHHKGFELATSITTWAEDFSSQKLGGTNLSAKAINGPVVFVIKKNKKIIENLIAWLHTQGSGPDASKLDLPMLLLDDEADYASINTNNADTKPTAVNEAIRGLLSVFAKNTYVGFTATPFANVFIDPEIDEDLFPRDYILSLESPSNYFGPEAMFNDENQAFRFMSPNDDAANWLPYKHKSSDRVGPLPESLLDAIAAFFIVNAIRDIRGDASAPRTMMVNVSRFNAVQKKVHEKIEELVSEWRYELKQGVGLAVTERLRRVFEQQFASQDAPWEQVQMVLDSAIHHIETKLVNSSTTNNSDWDDLYATDRARVIAVGGDVLSRGLTLPGLVTSYFRRKSVAYDTLMQMGRWFGYRDGYRDLCRLWIDPEIAAWYDFIAQATVELRDQIAKMRSLKQTPKQFGLAVRRHPGAALMATALNKRRTANIAQQVSLRNKSFESVRFDADLAINAANAQAAEVLIRKMMALAPRSTTQAGNPWWANVPTSFVIEFVENFKTAPADMMFSDGVILDHLKNTKAPWMKTWDVVVMSGLSKQLAFGGLLGTKKVNRAIYKKDSVLFSGGTKLRLGGRSDESQVLTPEQIAAARDKSKPKEPGDLHFRAQLRSPLLIIYPIDPSDSSGKSADTQAESGYVRFLPAEQDIQMVGVHIALPAGDDSVDVGADSELVTWYVNSIWLENNNLKFEDEE